MDAATKACTTTSVNPSALSAGGRVCVKVTNTFTPLTALIPDSTLTLNSMTQTTMSR